MSNLLAVLTSDIWQNSWKFRLCKAAFDKKTLFDW